MAERCARRQPAEPSAPLRIAVVGAGPVGLSLALQLRQIGSDARLLVYDAQPDAAAALADPRVLALSEGSRQLLDSLAAWPRAAATAIRRIHVSQHAQGLASLPRVTLDAAQAALPALGYTVRYGELLGALQAAAAAAGIEVAYGHAVQVRPQPGGVLLLDARGTPLEQPPCDLAVLAEGGAFHNQPRRDLHHDYRQTALIGRLRCEHPHDGLAVERFTEHGPLALLPQGADYALVWCVAERQAQDLLRLDPPAQLRALQALLPAVCGRAIELRLAASYPLGLNARLRAREGRVVQLGNAAQTLHPVAGQGLNLGLRDSAVLARALLGVPAARLDGALRRHDLARLPDRAALLGLTDLLARGFTWSQPGMPMLRAGALALLAGARPLRDALQRRMVFGWRM